MGRWSCLVPVVLLQGCAALPDPKGVLQPDSAAALISAIQSHVKTPLNMDTFQYWGLPGQEWEMAVVETDRVLQPDGTVRWHYLNCSTAWHGGEWSCNPQAHRTLRVEASDGRWAVIDLDTEVDAREARQMIVSVISELGRNESLPVCNSPDTSESSRVVLDEILDERSGGLSRSEGDLQLVKYGSVHFDFVAERNPAARLRCMDYGIFVADFRRDPQRRLHQ